MNVESIARVAHEANKAYCEVIGDHSQRSWDDAEQWQREAAIAGVQNPALDGRSRHESWMQDKLAAGWRYGPVKDGTAKTHPLLIPYEDLPIAEKRKDWLFNAVVSALTRSD